MPLPVQSLTSDSPMESIRKAISDSIAKLIKEGKSQKEAAGEAYGIARDRTGKELKGG